MPKAACYDVITDGNVSLSVPDDVDVSFPLSIASNVDPNVRSVLSFMVNPVNPDGLHFRMRIYNGDNQPQTDADFTLDLVAGRVIQEVLPSGILKRATNKKQGQLRIQLLGGTGTLNISDIVLWYYVDV